MLIAMLTTVDNPFSPFDHYNEWFAFDDRHGYQSASLLARLAMVSDDLSEADQILAIEQAIDEIVMENVTGLYRKVTKEFPESEVLDMKTSGS
jgi:hypothetical protein